LPNSGLFDVELEIQPCSWQLINIKFEPASEFFQLQTAIPRSCNLAKKKPKPKTQKH